MTVQPLFVVPGDLGLCGILGSILDRFPGQAHEDFGFSPTYPLDPLRRYQDLLARPPIPRGHFDIANGPKFIVQNKTVHMTDFAVRGLNVVLRDRFGTSQTGLAGFLPNPFRQRFRSGAR